MIIRLILIIIALAIIVLGILLYLDRQVPMNGDQTGLTSSYRNTQIGKMDIPQAFKYFRRSRSC